MPTLLRPLALLLVFLPPGLTCAAEALHARIDTLIAARANGKPVSPPADDAEFLRRITLDLAGRIPSASETRSFLQDPATDKRIRQIDTLLGSVDYPARMQDLFHNMFMEGLGDHPGWASYLHDSFTRNRPWDNMARDMLRGRADDASSQGATFFLSKRLENYGQNPVDYPGLARDIGRLFLGKDFRCAQCHDHLFIKDYKQADFQGLFGFIQNASLANAQLPSVTEKPLLGKVTFVSVFGKGKQETAPRLPGRKELAIPVLKKGAEFSQPPDPKTRTPGVLRFSPLAELAREVPESPDFSRNMVNRLWWAFLGRGLVHPLDLHHAQNPPSHPELLDLLAREFVTHKYDIKWLVRELLLTQTYQRSSLLPEGVTKVDPSLFTTALERRLSAEQRMWATLDATAMRESIVKASSAKPVRKKGKAPAPLTPLAQTRVAFARAFVGPVREPDDAFNPSLKAALFLLNDASVLAWFDPRPGNLVDRLGKLTDPGKIAEELYLSVLTRKPGPEEIEEVRAALEGKSGKERGRALGRLAWALVASTEFAVNH